MSLLRPLSACFFSYLFQLLLQLEHVSIGIRDDLLQFLLLCSLAINLMFGFFELDLHGVELPLKRKSVVDGGGRNEPAYIHNKSYTSTVKVEVEGSNKL